MTKKKTPRLLTQIERRNLQEGFYKYISRIETLIDKNINVQTKADLKKFKEALKKQLPYLRRF